MPPKSAWPPLSTWIVWGVALCVVLLSVAVLRVAQRRALERPPPAGGGAALTAAGAWFRGDFEGGGLDGWAGDLPRRDAVQVVTAPVRAGRHAVRISLRPGDVAAYKERTELRLADRQLERRHAGDGQTAWYAMSLLLPEDHADPPEGQYPILAQWHHRPGRPGAGGRPAHVTGPPPLALFLISQDGRQSLLLVHNETPEGPRRELGQRPIPRGRWIDLLFEIHWSTGPEGRIRAWLDGEPLTDGDHRGPTLYNPHGNYLRVGYYRAKGGTTTNHVFLDEVRIGASRPAVEP